MERERCDLMRRDNTRTSEKGPRRRCDNPECKGKVAWPMSPSRPSRFCSSACRQRSRAAQRRLITELEQLENQAEESGLRYVERRALQSRIAMLEWLLSAYPS